MRERGWDIPWGDLFGGLIFAVVVLGLVFMVRWLVLALVDYEPHCVYRIPLTDGRVYIGYARDPHVRLRRHRAYQRGLPDGHRRKWWETVPARVQATMVMPDEWVTWYRSKEVAEQMERNAIREAEASGSVVLANGIKYKGVGANVED
jgi:hypothetical protein